MSFKSLLFSSEGRVGRKTFWVWNVCYYLGIMVFAQGMNILFPAAMSILLPLFLLIILIPDLLITAKRWHDRDKSSWWLLLNIPLVIGRLSLPTLDPATAAEPSLVQSVISFAAIGCGLWILVECGFLKGTPGENRFGAEPK
ncbi:hypothetical protein BCU70_17055 [Vibrio sp. 10N.286.49.C2]|uniref:DUF805 domain-containing protein n=1 Tax=unclassified Vibrio TaxID=2614977 RepID=UPI000C85A924|nr:MULTISPECIES: DUF805 domain-containing protein [unclassified Vibrio]PMH36859.1 hypothetical protein BCU70_17055 [Vibrio sp. 10N.286.49.C2]PMH47908.1 hypothetical protein BCU66_21855 [Vibrio sp. 10N.286.49.B1]PMH83298.1 hypothetical protein BCU58_15270 [Vibrio sp. 10N.286.48.B7]